ncbi:MAG: flavin reductase family protein [Clostridia bacterium]|nr:flavin reductase family protein [Clostridia bacterium]
MPQFRSISPCTMLAPLPAVMVSCKGFEGDPNIITIGWTGTVCSHPPMVSISVRKERFSYHMIKETGEFVVNLVGRKLLKEVDFCGVKSGRDVNKWEAMNLTPLPLEALQYAPAIAQCPAYLGCKVKEVLSLGSHDMFLGEIVSVGAQEELFDEKGALHLDRAGMVCYSHGIYHFAGAPKGFFGFSLADEKVFKRRMAQLK